VSARCRRASINAENDGERFISVGENVSRMPDISVTDDQRERLGRVQAHLAEDVAYGHVRPRDALEFLLDRFEAASTPESTASAPSADETDEDADDAEAEFVVRNGGATTASVAGGTADERDDVADAAPTPSASESTDADDAATGDESVDDAGTGDDDARLNSVMSLLDDHDDVWREADGGDAKYEVDLPDGETERARTKDDVRAVLFKHYR
jgi:hypothetical protein